MCFQKKHEFSQMIEEEQTHLAEAKANETIGSFVLALLASVSPEHKTVAQRGLQKDPAAVMMREMLGQTIRGIVEQKAGLQE